MRCRSRNRSGDFLDRLGNLLGGGGLDVNLVHGDEADRLRRVGRLGRRHGRIERRCARIQAARAVGRRGGRRGGGCSDCVVVTPVALTRYLIVVQGAITMSSWSMPIMLAPLRLSTPMTLKVTF